MHVFSSIWYILYIYSPHSELLCYVRIIVIWCIIGLLRKLS